MSPSDRSAPPESSDSSDSLERLLPRPGGYRKLRSFQTARLVYDGTLIFCDRFIDKRSRTHDQMVQAARSRAQNIAEGSVASGTSKKTELKLTNVARASLEELLLDYQDFLRQRGLRLWVKDSPEALAVRRRYQSESSDQAERAAPYHFRTASPEVAANTFICLIHQASYLLGRHLENLDQTFLAQGGFTERLHAARTRSRAIPPPSPSERANSSARSKSPDPSDAAPPPACPRCGKPMVQRTGPGRPARRPGVLGLLCLPRLHRHPARRLLGAATTAALTERFGRGFARPNLIRARQFYLALAPEVIRSTLSNKSAPLQPHGIRSTPPNELDAAVCTSGEIVPTSSAESPAEIRRTPSGISGTASRSSPPFTLTDLAQAFPLPWSPYVLLLGRARSPEAFAKAVLLRQAFVAQTGSRRHRVVGRGRRTPPALSTRACLQTGIVILNEVKYRGRRPTCSHPVGYRRNSLRSLAGSFATLRMTRGENRGLKTRPNS